MTQHSARWDQFFVRLATASADMSRDPSTKVGAVIVRPNRTVVSLGFNGFPRGVDDAPNLYADRDEKLRRTVHAELNAILTAREPLDGTTLYCTHPPCSHCAAAIIQAGITTVVSPPASQHMNERWGPSFATTKQMFNDARVAARELREVGK